MRTLGFEPERSGAHEEQRNNPVQSANDKSSFAWPFIKKRSLLQFMIYKIIIELR